MMVRILALVAACCIASVCQAQTPDGYPSRPVKIIVPFAAGGPTDVVARLVAKGLAERLKQQFYVENLPGAGGNLGTVAAAKSPGDGYTLLFVASSFVVNPSLYVHVPYDARKDFKPVMMVGDGPNLLIVNPSLPAANAKEFVALMKANPGKYTFASAGVGTTTHLSGELMKASLGLDLTHVPFAGSGPVIQSLAGGHTPIAFTTIPPALSLIKEGKIRALAVLAKKRAAVLPDVPTMEEAGFPARRATTSRACWCRPARRSRSSSCCTAKWRAWSRRQIPSGGSRHSGSTWLPTRRSTSPRRSTAKSRSGAK